MNWVCMLSKNYRLRLKNDFDRLFKEGKFAGHAFLTLGFAKNNLNNSRFAVIVAKKVSKKAVKRNSIKRKIVEIIRLDLQQIKPGFDLVFIAKPEIQGKKYKEIKAAVSGLLKRARFIE
ncbi:MAG: ribonuclease P protein component [Patescibacteria group bacterium]|nr:ribonuclease P protein component [Patescibacteria group bacterium]MBU4142109.1 ribonuclease P protein component [Patescibacteria group bacterium]